MSGKTLRVMDDFTGCFTCTVGYGHQLRCGDCRACFLRNLEADHVKTKYSWKEDDFHAPNMCFFCKEKPASTVCLEYVYKTLQIHDIGIGDSAKYTKKGISVPCCDSCMDIHQRRSKETWCIAIVGYVIAFLTVCYWLMQDSSSSLVACLAMSIMMAIPLSFIPSVVLLVLYSLVKHSDNPKAEGSDYPVLKQLLAMDWKTSSPNPKFEWYKNTNMSSSEIDALNRKHHLEADEIMYDYIAWCKANDNRTRHIQPGRS